MRNVVVQMGISMAWVRHAGVHAMGRVPTTMIGSRDLAEEVSNFKAQHGGEIIVYGGYTLAQALPRANLVDEYRLVISPVALGSGEPLFKDLPVERRLRLAEVTPYPDGTVISIYRRPR